MFKSFHPLSWHIGLKHMLIRILPVSSSGFLIPKLFIFGFTRFAHEIAHFIR